MANNFAMYSTSLSTANCEAVGRSSVQREAYEACLPKQADEWLGEPTMNKLANASLNEPQRVVIVGGRRPAAAHSAATLYEVVARTARVSAVATPSCACAMQPSKRVAALCAAAPKIAKAICWRSFATKGKQKCAYKASSLGNQALSALADRPKVGLMVRIFERREQRFMRPKSSPYSDIHSDATGNESLSELTSESSVSDADSK